ncbi:hypothetical protein JI752_009590 [Lysobacter sp. MMG2]|uniref:hypothetical protein n=1 Tax=Lysobacter sp. MMG2 TaxID=2801338 RepID=UPI001C2164A5|nr:hypothetical protein [Lysobacter sp. MMG2]MBU8976389.1 hypothetical protein [Lysobacter sp. MMG2]
MEEIVERLDQESEDAIALLPGCKMQSLLSESADIQAGQSLIQVLSVSIQLEKERFLVIESDWRDTPKEWLDYHCLSVRLAGAPRGIRYNPNPPKNAAPYTFDHLSVHLGAAVSVATVDVLEACVAGELESVTYDAGLLVTRTDGLKIGIIRADSIIGALLIAHTPRDIDELLAGLTVRVRYGG